MMRWLYLPLLCLLTSCGFLATYSLQPSRTTIEGMVRTSLGPVAGCRVSLLRLGGEALAEGMTGTDGRFQLTAEPADRLLLKATGALELRAIARVEPGKKAWVVLSPGSTMLLGTLEALRPIETLSVTANWERLSTLLDRHPLLAAGTLDLLGARIQAFQAPMAVAVRQAMPTLRTLSPSTEPETLENALLAQLIEQLPAETGEWGSLIGVAAQRIESGTLIQTCSPTAYLYWEQGRLSTLEGNLRLGDPAANRQPQVKETVRILLRSVAEPQGEEVYLAETALDSGVFRGTVSMERQFGEDGNLLMQAKNGKLALCADGERTEALVLAEYAAAKGRLESQARFAEPTSTVTGVIKGFEGAEVRLAKQGFNRQGTARADGTYVFYGVPSGSYLLSARKGDQTTTEYKTVP